MVVQPQKYNDNITIEVHSGLVPETNLLLGGDLKSIRSLYLMKSAPTIALNSQGAFENSEIFSIPKEIYVDEIYTVKFSNNFILQCTAGTLIRGLSGWIVVSELKKDDKILGAIFSENSGIKPMTITVEEVNKEFKSLRTQVYFFASKHGNILLPSYHEDNDNSNLTFICVSQ